MDDLQKAKLLLKLLSTQQLTLQGSKEAFEFCEAYKWLHTLTKAMEQKVKDGHNGQQQG